MSDLRRAEPSLLQLADTSLVDQPDTSPEYSRDGRVCTWCQGRIPTTARKEARTCSHACRQALYAVRRQRTLDTVNARPARFAYADPPYPGFASKYYSDDPLCAEVDHVALVQQLMAGGYKGWALSTSQEGLRIALPHCPPQATVCTWAKPNGCGSAKRGIYNRAEFLIVVPGRELAPPVPNFLFTSPARGGSPSDRALMGRKPKAFCLWLFALLGMRPGDQLDDLYPGTGMVGRCWRVLSAEDLSDVSSAGGSDVSRVAVNDTSTPAPGDG